MKGIPVPLCIARCAVFDALCSCVETISKNEHLVIAVDGGAPLFNPRSTTWMQPNMERVGKQQQSLPVLTLATLPSYHHPSSTISALDLVADKPAVSSHN